MIQSQNSVDLFNTKEKVSLCPPVSYQGGKNRIANQIIDIIGVDKSKPIYDLCCGSGAISLAFVNRGLPPQNIIMADQGPWGSFWHSVSCGSFDMQILNKYCQEILDLDPHDIQDYIKKLSENPARIHTEYVFLLLQAASFGSKAIWIENGRWRNTSFRNYWQPTETSNRKSPVNPMMPMPETLMSRVKNIIDNYSGFAAFHTDINNLYIPEEAIIYIDPPYDKTTTYGHKVEVLEFIKNRKNKIFISEGKPLSDVAYEISFHSSKGGISGSRKKPHSEWLSEFN